MLPSEESASRHAEADDDKFDGRIDVGFYDRKTGEWRGEQRRICDSIEQHENENANRSYMDQGIALVELASLAVGLFENQEPREKRRLLDFVLSNCN